MRSELITIWDTTSGHCHFCGDKLSFENYSKSKLDGGWNIDHIFPKAKGGENISDNYLLICGECNGLKWHRTGEQIQEFMRYGLVSLRERRRNSHVGREISEIYELQQEANKKRRKNNSEKQDGVENDEKP